MHRLVMVLGGITAAMGALFFLLILITSSSTQDRGSVLFAAGIGGSFILSGAILFCFGAIVEHLIAIRAAAERQVEIFDRLGKPKA